MKTILPLAFSDVEKVAILEEECFQSEKWSAALFYDELNDPSKHYVVCKENDIIIGFAGYAQILDEGHIMNIAVSKQFRKEGVATALLQTLLSTGKENGISAFTLEVRVSNYAAKRLYEKNGFHSVGVRKRYYPDKEDAEIYWLFFSGGEKF